MKGIMSALIIMTLTWLQAQEQTQNNRNGWFFGTAGGVSVVHLSTAGLSTENQSSLSFPNFKVGKMIRNRTALLVYLPGSIYRYKGIGRERDRGFEGIIPSVQYWLKPRWWVLAGAGLTFDAPAFYDIKSEDERKFYFGPSVIAATGIELWRKNRFTLDIQARFHGGYSVIPEGKRSGLNGSFLVGLNWYFHKHE
jgi:hypothetical protein